MIATRPFTRAEVKRAYDRRSWLYSKTIAEMERDYHQIALNAATIQPGEKVLEVAVGPGLTFLELARRVGAETPLTGVDLSTGMLHLTEQRMLAHGYNHFQLKAADCRALPFADNTFDVLYNGYMLDLMPEDEMPHILAEFKRVLRPGGRLVLLNMSKADQAPTRREMLYQKLPAPVVLYLMGGCRPVLMEGPTKAAGFEDVTRTFVGGKAPSEIVLGTKP